MLRPSKTRLIACVLAVVAVGVISAGAASAHQRDGDRGRRHDDKRHERFPRHRHFPHFHFGPGYTVTPLVSDQTGVAPTVDPDLVNGWGISASATSPWWVANQGSKTSTLYSGLGVKAPLTVSVPGGPTGTVFNGGTGFPVKVNGAPLASRFLFATLAGTIEGWPGTPLTASVTAIPAHDNAVYTGLAISPDSSTLYAADFANGRVDVWDSTWAPVKSAGAFVDPWLTPSQHYAPFGIQAIGDSIFVTYAKQPATPGPEVHGPGLGLVDQFSLSGQYIARVGAFGDLDAPWGLAMAPASFGRHSLELLVGNFGDGHITTFKQIPGGRWVPDGQLRTSDGHRLAIDGLWGIGFGNGAASGPTNSLYFAAGPADETHGLFGSITAN